MPIFESTQNSARPVCKNVHPPEAVRSEKLQQAVLAEVLKTIEMQFQARGLIDPIEPGTFNPIWFLAETEQNIFLWRHGYSLVEKEDFEFWVNVEALLEKRLNQLSSFQPDNPFVNPLWGLALPDPELIHREVEYLHSFRRAFGKIEAHAHALSQVGNILKKELAPAGGPALVLLPEPR